MNAIPQNDMEWVQCVYSECGYDLANARLILSLSDESAACGPESAEWQIYYNPQGYYVQVNSNSAYMTDFGRAESFDEALELCALYDDQIVRAAWHPDDYYDDNQLEEPNPHGWMDEEE